MEFGFQERKDVEPIYTPSNYIDFLNSEHGRPAYAALQKALDHVRPYALRATIAVVVALVLTFGGFFAFQKWWGAIAIIPAIYFVVVYFRENEAVSKAHKVFRRELLFFFFGEESTRRNERFDRPNEFVKSLDDVVGYSATVKTDLGKYGQVYAVDVERERYEESDGKSQRDIKTTKENGHAVRLPYQSLVRSKRASFFFNDRKTFLDGFSLSGRTRRSFDLTDTELNEWFDVSVGGLKDLFVENPDEQQFWTRIMSPYFEQVIKALVAKYGRMNISINDGYFYINVERRAPGFDSVDFGKMDKRYLSRVWLSNHEGNLQEGHVHPNKVIPYLYRLFLNRIMHAMTIYFLMDSQHVSNEEREEAKWVLDYVVSQFHAIDTQAMEDQFKMIREGVRNV
ncbi:hypothetical protein J2S70_001290 [Trueperella bonasi]|uniref:DUF3137 domain-containing protein n=1 Tax=Trueperella bonasi TaxID=312286 RepID=A0ABT9NH25_9ACTO|nr:hypothetical protein [Trueperella bonasi]MDP9806708.1 hypothetical protein [Trueperella bonasi]